MAIRWSALVLFLGLMPGLLPAADAPPGKFWVYVGTYTGKNSKGIYRLEFDPATGKLTNQGLAGETINPTFLAIHPNQRFLYAVGEIGNFKGQKSGAINAFAIDPKSGGFDAPESATVRRRRPVPHRHRQGGQERAGGQLRRRQHLRRANPR